MKIVHIVEATATGTLAMIKLAADAQVLSGYEVYIVYSKRPETPPDMELMFDGRVRFLNIQMITLLDKIQAIFKIRKRVTSIHPDAIFLHSSMAGFLGRLSLLISRFEVYYIPHCISFMRKDISTFLFFVFVLFEWIACLKKSVYVACSESELNTIRKYIPFSVSVLVENAVQGEHWYKVRGIRTNTIVTVGQIRPQKNPHMFASIARKVVDIQGDVEFIWVGDGDKESRKILEKSGVTVVGWQSSDIVKKYLSSSSIYLSTAQWEGLPVSPIEAILSGNVAVLSNCLGNVDVIIDKETGFLFESEDQAVDLINYILGDENVAIDIVSTAQTHCKNRFSVERYITDINDLYGR